MHKTDAKYAGKKDLDTVKGIAVPAHVIERVADEGHSVLTL